MTAQPRPPRPPDDAAPAPCECPCHGDPQIRHIAPCCRPCPHCGARFQAGLPAHEAACAARPA